MTAIDDLYAERAALDLAIAEASITTLQAFVAILNRSDVTALMAEVTTAVSTLDEGWRNRVAGWTTVRANLVVIGNAEIARFQKLIDDAEA